MVMHSSVPTLKAALVERWKLLPSVVASTDVGVSWGNPHPDTMADVVLVIDDTKEYELEFTAGMTQANETYKVSCLIDIIKPVRENRVAQWQRVYDVYFDVINDLVALNLNGPMPAQVNIIWPEPAHDSDATAPDVRDTSLMFDLNVKARLS